jgi:hypothetical protein
MHAQYWATLMVRLGYERYAAQVRRWRTDSTTHQSGNGKPTVTVRGW